MSKSDVHLSMDLTVLNEEADKLQEFEDPGHATDDGDRRALPLPNSVGRVLKAHRNRALGARAGFSVRTGRSLLLGLPRQNGSSGLGGALGAWMVEGSHSNPRWGY
ncbi:MAG: hypothetical protein ACI8QS_002383 [Planctomycetota bacterium]|jgi:hypothetical protein